MIIKIGKIEIALEEFLVGCVYGGCLAWYYKWWTIPIVLLSGILWSLGGAHGITKAVRRFGCPLMLLIPIMLVSHNYYIAISIIAHMIILSIGYGIPSFNGPAGSCDDEGSALGKFVWYTTLKQKSFSNPSAEVEADVIVRGIIGFALGITLVPMAFYSLPYYTLTLMFLTIAYPAVTVMVD